MPGKSNRIQVDLDLLQDSAAKLEAFNRDFGSNVDRLAGIMGTAQMGGGQQAGQPSSSASTSTGTDQLFARLQGQGGTLLNAPPTPPGAVSDNASVAAPFPGEGSVEQQMIRFQRRVGSGETAIPVGFRQALGYYAEGELGLPNFLSKDIWRPGDKATDQERALYSQSKSGRMRYRAQKANDALFQLQAVKANSMLLMGKYTKFFGGAMDLTNAGTATNAGANRSGHIPTPWGNIPTGGLFSGAMMHGLNEGVWQPMVSSTFGLNPAYSMSDAQEARAAINSYGWSHGNMGDWLANTLKQNTVRTGIDGQTQMALLDPALRWGGSSFQQLNTALQELPAAATAAGYNVRQFTQELASTVAQLSQATGLSTGMLTTGITAISATTGLPPGQVGSLVNMQNIMMAAGTTGDSLGSIMYGGKQGDLLARPLEIFKSMLQGHSANQIAHWLTRGNASQKAMARDIMAKGPGLQYMNNHEIFGGMSPFQALHMLAANGSISGLVRRTNMQSSLSQVMQNSPDTDANHRLLDRKLEAMLGNYFPGNKSRDASMLADYQKEAKGSLSNRRALAERLMNKYGQKDRRDQAKQMIGLTPDAKKLVQLMGNDPGHSNSGGVTGFARSAIHYGGEAAQITGDVLGLIP